MNKFILKSKYSLTGDQPKAFRKLSRGFKSNLDKQILLGVTGSGKTFTAASVIEKINKPTLVISHNKTLAVQLYNEFKELFPDNAVRYFVSYYDYYQPEAYVPRTDTYIEKEADINEEIDRLRNAATAALLSRKDTLIVASVSCIYGLGSPEDYSTMKIEFEVGKKKNQEKVMRRLLEIRYDRNDQSLGRGKFRARGDVLDIFPSYEDRAVRIQFDGDVVEKIRYVDPLTGELGKNMDEMTVFPAKHFVTPKERLMKAEKEIISEMRRRVSLLKKKGKLLEAQRLEQRTNYDIEMIRETGYCSGIENYSRYLSGRAKGEPPATLIDFFPEDFLVLIDESHMTVPQIRGMYNGDRSRKETLVEHGFRLPSALDNRPLRIDEFEKLTNRTIYISATSGPYEFEKASKGEIGSVGEYHSLVKKGKKLDYVSEQVIRPTGLLDPEIEVRGAKGQIDDLYGEIKKRVANKQRVLVTTLTKRMSEDLSEYLKDLGIKVNYLHSEINTLERPEILRDLRSGVYDVVVGVNLLREGLDLPEVSLVAILDADEEGFLRGENALIQTIGRAARHKDGEVIMYGDNTTSSMKEAISETERRRKIQEAYNKKHKITPKSIKKGFYDSIVDKKSKKKEEIDMESIPKDEIKRILKELKDKMEIASKNLEFEEAARIRDEIADVRERMDSKRIR